MRVRGFRFTGELNATPSGACQVIAEAIQRMTATRKQVLAWATKLSVAVDVGRPTKDREFDMAIRVLREPSLLAALPERKLHNLVWNLGWMMGRKAWRDIALARQTEFVEAVPGFLAWLPSSTEDEQTTIYMFWDLAISRPDPHTGPIREAMFGALSAQLAMPSVWLQYSALHGFGHLKDPRSRPVIRNFLRTCDEPWLEEYALQAMHFEVM
jgi:hypothetical protein